MRRRRSDTHRIHFQKGSDFYSCSVRRRVGSNSTPPDVAVLLCAPETDQFLRDREAAPLASARHHRVQFRRRPTVCRPLAPRRRPLRQRRLSYDRTVIAVPMVANRPDAVDVQLGARRQLCDPVKGNVTF